ncbi:hypothetical protein RI543_002150 [Arxiozyma heterogenica]|uniref:F-box domain-containing protein n=1 Tax=Arxiozyma heterogenica TaxID=278026 RepID=A0AAN7W3H4_9SACH|nr:hypothetical protein RI543_002150 [Kazachstania heterogenica]
MNSLRGINSFPIEIWNQILLNLDLKDIFHVSRCNHQIRDIVTNNVIWENIVYEIWGQYEQFDILQNYRNNNQTFHSVKKNQHGTKQLYNYWYIHFLERMYNEYRYLKILDQIVQNQWKISYWGDIYKLLQDEDFILYVPLLNDIVDSEFLTKDIYSFRPQFIDHYRVTRLKLLNCFKSSLPLKKISFELLCGFRHKLLFQFILLYKDISNYDSYNTDVNHIFFLNDDDCEKLLLQYNTMDTAFHRLLPYRHRFLELFRRILKIRNRNHRVNFNSLTTLKKLEILSNLVMNLLKRSMTRFLTKNYTEDLMILRVYSGETKGTLLIHLAILQRIFLEYGIKCQILQRHLKIYCHTSNSNGKNGQHSAFLYLTVMQDSLQCKILTEHQLRTIIGETHFNHYMKPLSKQDALRWLNHEFISNPKSNFETNQINNIFTKWDKIYCHSHLPLSNAKLRAFNIIYNSLFSKRFFNAGLKLHHILSDSFDIFMEGMTPLDYILLDYIRMRFTDLKKTEINYMTEDNLLLHQTWLRNQYMIENISPKVSITLLHPPSTEDTMIIIGNLYTFSITSTLTSIVCIINKVRTGKNKNNLIVVMDIFGDVHKVHEKDFVQNIKKMNWNTIENQNQLDLYIKIMTIIGKLGFLFDHIEIQRHQYILSPNSPE